MISVVCVYNNSALLKRRLLSSLEQQNTRYEVVTAPRLPGRRYTYRDSGAKRILFDGKTLLPEDFDLQTKQGFGMPFGRWMNGPLRETLMDTLSEKRIRERGLLNVQE